MSHLSTKLRVCLLGSILVTVRGVRGRRSGSWGEEKLSDTSLNLIPYANTYEGYWLRWKGTMIDLGYIMTLILWRKNFDWSAECSSNVSWQCSVAQWQHLNFDRLRYTSQRRQHKLTVFLNIGVHARFYVLCWAFKCTQSQKCAAHHHLKY